MEYFFIHHTAICPEPQINSLTASNITFSSADLSWVSNGSEISWNIEYGVSGFGQGSGTIINVNSNPYTLTGLSSATNYDYWVQADVVWIRWPKLLGWPLYI